VEAIRKGWKQKAEMEVLKSRNLKMGAKSANATSMRHQSHIRATSEPPQSLLIANW